MRPGQNKRMRGRNNRRGPNPLTRSFESNGPDVKIRGTAAHVAEKYVQLARDAHASGDPVAAENYLQHAEHYLRLIAAAQQQQFQAQQAMQSGARVEDTDDFEGEDEFESSVMDRFTFRAPQAPTPPGYQGDNGNGDQPRQDYQPRNDMQRNDMPRQDREGRQDRDHRQEREPRHEREPRQDGQRNEHGRNDQPRENREFRRDRNDFRRDRNFDRDRGFPRPERQPQPIAQPQPDIVEADAALPAFITAPVRIPIESAVAAEQPAMPALAATETGEGADGYAPRPRRRRVRRGPRDEFAPTEASEGAGDVAASVAAETAPTE